MKHLYAGAIVGGSSFALSLAVLIARQILMVLVPEAIATGIIAACLLAAVLIAVIDYVSER